MEQSNKIQRSEVWEEIYKIVKTIPRADCNGTDAPDAPSVATELEELFLKLLPIQHVSQRRELFVCETCGGLLATKEGEECFSCANPIDTTE